jgi:hypothetical protein
MYTYIWKIFLRKIIGVTSKKTYRFKNKNCSNFNTMFSYTIHPVLFFLRTVIRTSVSFSRTQHCYLKRWLQVSAFQKAICRPSNKFNRPDCMLEMFALYGNPCGIT